MHRLGVSLFILGVALITLTLLGGCGAKHKEHSNPDGSAELTAKFALYSELVKGVQDVQGFVDTYECNSLQRSGLLCASGVGGILLQSAEEAAKPGRFYRRPTTYPECHQAGESRSTISPDDLLGAWWCAYQTGDLAALERIWAYGSPRTWFMGDDDEGGFHTLLKPHQVATLAALIKKLGGSDHIERQYHPITWLPCEGFECALQIYEIMLRGKAEGGISAADRSALQYAASRQRLNPLAQMAWHLYSDGDQAAARELLLSDPRWPSDKLPSTQTVCDAWSVQRDDNTQGLLPCPDETRIHSGGDWLFVASFLLKE